MIIPLKKAKERVDIVRDDSDTTLFMNLMYSGEQLLKLITCAMISGIEDSKGNKDNDQYSQNYKLVHADSIGYWSQVLENVITGPGFHFLRPEFKDFWSEINDKVSNPSWQYGALVALNNCVKVLNEKNEEIPTKSQLKNWFHQFVKLRNDARGHGVMNAEEASRICPNLETSIKLISENFSLFEAPWVYIKQNLSGTYRISPLGESEIDDETKEELNKLTLEDGVYIYLNKPYRVNLLESSAEAIDFFLPNGNFRDKSYECISYISGKKLYKDSYPYLKPPGQLPSSETEGKGQLDLINNTFTNIPYLQSIYINRKELEEELESILLFEDTYPIITLLGRGGIGKTSLALHVLHKLCQYERFDAIVWLSARDIDLLDEGPKIVKPQILDEADIAFEFTLLLEPPNFRIKGFDYKQFIEKELREAGAGTNGKILFVMDNFETLRNPLQVYKWLSTHIRNPNKILITSRLRDFKADYPITLKGMNRIEFNELVEKIGLKLELQNLLDKVFLDELYRESDGHPYVVKVMLGEVSMQKGSKNLKRIIASKDEILTALFERTYSNLSISAKRIFLTLCSWRNILPEVAIECVLNREDNDLIYVEDGIEELFRYSFIEIIKSNEDDSNFIAVPLTAFEFGRKKLSVNPLKSKIQLDVEILNYFGVSQFTDISRGLRPRIEQFFRNVAFSIKKDSKFFTMHLPLLEFLCRKFPDGWLMLSNLYRELNNFPKAIDAIENYVSDHRPSVRQKIDAWERSSKLYALHNDYRGLAHSLVEMCKIDEIDFYDLNNGIRSLMDLFQSNSAKFKKEEVSLLLTNVATKMNSRINMGEGSTRDITHLAEVYIFIGKNEPAKRLVRRALKKEPRNFYAVNLAKDLKIDTRGFYSE